MDMGRSVRAVFVFGLLAVLSLALGQESVSRVGQNYQDFSQGGLGGGVGSSVPTKPTDEERRLINSFFSPEDLGVATVKSAILTPGERVDYSISLSTDETLVATVSSDSFDPALELLDPSGKVIKKCDDRFEGDQEPFIAYEAAKAGTYKVRVVSFRSKAGGKFHIRLRKILATEVQPGPFQVPASREDDDHRHRVWVKFKCKKDAYYALFNVSGYDDRTRYGYHVTVPRIVGPLQALDTDHRRIYGESGTYHAFQALLDGTFYAQVDVHARDVKVSGTLAEMVAVDAKPDTEYRLNLQSSEQAVFRIPIDESSPIDVKFKIGSRMSVVLTTTKQNPDNPYDARGTSGDPLRASSRTFEEFGTMRSEPQNAVYMFKTNGVAEFLLKNHSRGANEVSFRYTKTFPVWKSGQSLNEKLEVGECKFYELTSEPAELMKIQALANTFAPQLQIYSLNGELMNSLFNPLIREIREDLYFKEARKFLVRLTCDGYGGSGTFELRRDPIPSRAYELGRTISASVTDDTLCLFEVQLEKGRRYELVLDTKGVSTNVDLLDDAGEFLTSSHLGFGEIIVHYFTPPRSGRHRLWLRGPNGFRVFNFRAHSTPKP